MLLVGTPLLMNYVVRPGDTVSEIAERHDTTVSALVEENDLHPSGNQVASGGTLTIPSAHGRASGVRSVDPDARKVVSYTVRPGDTATGLAVRFHAWTAELVSMNRLDAGNTLQVGDRIKIPIVLAAVADEPAESSAESSAAEQKPPALDQEQRRLERRLGDPSDPSTAKVRRIIEHTSRRYGVDPQLALAVSWQEAGWRQHHVSYATAIGAMQVIPSTGEWMSGVVGRDLDLLDVRDNVTAGVVLLRELQGRTSQRKAVAGYYQGLASVQSRGMYDDTRAYVANVLALKRQFERGDYPG